MLKFESETLIAGSSLPAMLRPPEALHLLRTGIALQAGNGMFYYTYVLLSEVDNNHYIGWTNNLKDRVAKHNKGLVKATKYRRPFKLIYFEACLTKDKAIDREKQLKSGFGRSYLKRRIS